MQVLLAYLAAQEQLQQLPHPLLLLHPQDAVLWLLAMLQSAVLLLFLLPSPLLLLLLLLLAVCLQRQASY
jgi:hypothetical protein